MRAALRMFPITRLLALAVGLTATSASAVFATVVLLPDKTQFDLPTGFEALPDDQLRAFSAATEKNFSQPTKLVYAANRYGPNGKPDVVFNIRAFPSHHLTQAHMAQLEKDTPATAASALAQGLPSGTTLVGAPAIIRVGKRRAIIFGYYARNNGIRLHTNTVRLYDGPNTIVATCSYHEPVANGAATCSALLRSLQ